MEGNYSTSSELSHPDLIYPSTVTEFWLRICEAGIVNPLGVVTNLFTLICMLRKRLDKNWTYGMIINLCLCNIIMCLTTSLFTLPGILTKRWMLGNFICFLRQYLGGVTLLNINLTFVVSAFQRYILIVHNRSWRIFHNKSVPYLLSGMWLFSLLIVIPFGYPGRPILFKYRDACVMENDAAVIMYITFCIFILGIPFIVVPSLYLHIFIVVKKSSKAVTGSSKKSSKENKTALVLFIIYLFFTLAFLPFSLNFLFNKSTSIHFIRTSDALCWLSVYIGLVINPILYTFLFAAIKESILDCLPKRFTNVLPSVTTVQSSA